MSAVNDTLIPSGPASLATSWQSEALYTNSIYLLSIGLVFSGTPNGVFSLQYSNDDYQSGQTPQTWKDIVGSSIAISEAGDHTWNFSSFSFNWLKVVYTRSSGTGNITSAQYHGKGV